MEVIPKWIGGDPPKVDPKSKWNALNIYEEFRPLALLSKVSMVLPVSNLTKDENLKFSFYSFGVLYVLVMNLCIGYCIPSQIHYDDRYQPSTIKESLGFLISNCWFVFGQNILIRLIEKVDQFDRSLMFESKIKVPKRLNKHIWAVAGLGYPVLLLVMVSLSRYHEEPCTQYKCPLMEVVRGFFRYQHHLQLVFYMFFCSEIKIRFKALNEVFDGFIETISMKPLKDDICPQFENRRLQYARLIQCTKILNQLFGWRFAFILAIIILHAVWLLYFFHTEEGYVINGYEIVFLVYSFIILMFVTHITDLLVIEVS